MKDYQIKDRQNDTKVIQQEYFECYEYWYDDDWGDDWLECEGPEYEYLSEEVENKILGDIPYFDNQTNLYIYIWKNYFRFQLGKGCKMGRLIDNVSYYSLDKKRDILLDALFSSSVEEPSLANYCQNWNQLL